jgi:hypothetical protein
MIAWNQVNESVILNSIKVAGFDNEIEWHITSTMFKDLYLEMHGSLETYLEQKKQSN